MDVGTWCTWHHSNMGMGTCSPWHHRDMGMGHSGSGTTRFGAPLPALLGDLVVTLPTSPHCTLRALGAPAQAVPQPCSMGHPFPSTRQLLQSQSFHNQHFFHIDGVHFLPRTPLNRRLTSPFRKQNSLVTARERVHPSPWGALSLWQSRAHTAQEGTAVTPCRAHAPTHTLQPAPAGANPPSCS